MRIFEVLSRHNEVDEDTVDEAPATRKLCLSSKPDSALGASNLSSCISQGYRAHDPDSVMSHKIGGHRTKTAGKKIKGRKYGGPLPDYSAQGKKGKKK